MHTPSRQTHEQRILATLRSRGSMRRGDLAAAVGISRTTLSEVASGLLDRGAITVVSTDAPSRSGSGRPAQMLALDPRSGQYIGIDFAHGHVRAAVADAAHEILASGLKEYSPETPWNARVQAAFDLLDEFGAREGVTYGVVQGIGIGVAGPYSALWRAEHASAPDKAENARGLVSRAFTERFGVVPQVDNNTRFAAFGEAVLGDTPAVQDLLYLRVADGIGGGLVVGGRLVSGSRGIAGELGHVTAVPGGERCRCGKAGCLETVASAPSIFAECTARGTEVRELSDLVRALERADPKVEDVLREAGAAVGRVLATAVLALNPSEIVIGGPLARVADIFVQQIASTVTFEVHPILDPRPAIRVAQLGDEGAALGAIAALFRQSSLLAGYTDPEGSITNRIQRSMP